MRVVAAVALGIACAACAIQTSGLGEVDGAGVGRDDAGAIDGGRIAEGGLDGSGPGSDGATGIDDGGGDGASALDAEVTVDAGWDPCTDAPVPDTFVLCPFGAPRRIDVLSVADATDDDPTLTRDLLEMYFNSNRDGGEGFGDIYVSRRGSATEPWGAPSLVIELSTPLGETTPEIAEDGLTIWVAADRAGGEGDSDIWRWTRASRSAPWQDPEHIPELSTAERDVGAAPTRDGLWVTVSILPVTRPGDWDLHVSSRARTSDPWGPLVPLAELNTTGADLDGFFDGSGTHLFFDTSFGTADRDLVVASRPAPGAPFGAATRIPMVNTTFGEEDVWISDDLRYIAFASARSGSMDLYEASR